MPQRAREGESSVKALVLRQARQLELVDIPRPALRCEGHVLVQVKACGICGSDLRYWAGENPWALHTLGRQVPNPPNMVLGHEFSGIVTEARSTRFEHLLGQRVGVQAFRTCGTCALCTSGRENLCRDTVHIGHAQGWGTMPYYPGAYAEYCLAWGDLVFPMAGQVSFAEEAMRDILGVAVHAVGRVEIHAGDVVLCIGGGPAGLCIAQVAKARGAGRVVLSDPSAVAQGVIDLYPELAWVDPREGPLGEVLEAQCGVPAVDVVYDTVGSASTMQEGLSLLATSGTYVDLAVHAGKAEVQMLALGSERTITSSSNARYRDEREAHGLIERGTVDLESMITHHYALDAYEEAYGLLLAKPKRAYKVVFGGF
jgi:threonine dehydrogenase-like Zn-dependent dehydrogenase